MDRGDVLDAKMTIEVESLPRVGPDRKDDWFVVIVIGPKSGEKPWKKSKASEVADFLYDGMSSGEPLTLRGVERVETK